MYLPYNYSRSNQEKKKTLDNNFSASSGTPLFHQERPETSSGKIPETSSGIFWESNHRGSNPARIPGNDEIVGNHRGGLGTDSTTTTSAILDT